MTVDRNSIVTLHKKVRVILARRKSCIFVVKLFGMWLKKFKETGETCNRPGQGRKRTVRTKRLVKNTREKLRRNSRRSAAKMAAEAGISQTSMRRNALKFDASVKLHSINMYQGSTLFPVFRALSRSLHRHSSVA